MWSLKIASVTAASFFALATPVFGQGQQAATPKDRSYVGQMTEEQIKQKLEGEGFSQVSELKKVPVTKYRWTGKAVRNGKPMEVAIDELGHVSAK